MVANPNCSCQDPRPLVAGGVPRGRHIEMLVIAVLAIAGSFVLNVGPEDRVHVRCLPTSPIPKTCLTRDLFGVDCPGCGLTRSFIHLAHWDWKASWKMHRLGWLLFLATLLQVPYRAQALLSKKGGVVPAWMANQFGRALIVLLIVNWVSGIVFVSMVRGN